MKTFNLAKEVTVMLLKNEAWDRIKEEYSKNNFSLPSSYIAIPVDKVKFTKQKQKSIFENECRRLYSSNIEEYDILTIPNKDFSLELVKESSVYYGMSIELILHHKEFEKYNYPIHIKIDLNNFLNLLNSSRYIINGKISGNIIFNTPKEKSPIISIVNVVLDDGSDEMRNYIEYGKILSESKKTTSFIPGHLYLNSDSTRFIYLGTKNQVFFERYRRNKKAINQIFGASLYGYTISPEPGELILPLEKSSYIFGEDTIDFIEENKGKDFEVFCKEYLDYVYLNDTKFINSIFSTKVLSSAVDMGEFFPKSIYVQKDTVEEIISKFCSNKIIEVCNSSVNTKNPEIYFGGLKKEECSSNPELSNHILKTISASLQQEIITASGYSWLKLNKDSTSKDVIDICKFGSRYFNSLTILIEKYFIDITDEKLKEIITSSLDIAYGRKNP